MNKKIGKKIGKRGKIVLAVLIAVMFIGVATTTAILPYYETGADFSGYEAPSDPDVIVSTTAELEAAVINGVVETILVKAGTYTPTWGGGYMKGLKVDDSDKLYAEYAPNSVNPSVIDGGTASISSGLTGVTISGFEIKNGGISGATSCEISYNIMSTGGVSYLGSNNLVINNQISGSGDPEDAGIHIAGSGNTVQYNTIEGFTAGEDPYYNHGRKGAGICVWTFTDDTTIEYNEITGNTIGVMVTGPDREGVTSATDVIVNYNNIVGNADYGVFNAKCPGSGDWYYWEYDKYTPADSIVVATNNWWGHATGTDHIINPHGTGQGGDAVSDNVDFIPWYATSTTTPSTEYVTVAHNPIIAVSDTIQGGIDASLDGDIINVAAGIYNEEISIDKSVTLNGAQANVPIVDGVRAGDESVISGTLTSWPYKRYCVVRIKHSDVVINGFTIEGGKQWNIAIQGVKPDGISNILISYNYIKESGYDGIFRDTAAADVTIDHNYIASNPRGVATNGGATTITDNTFYHNGQGIAFYGGDPYSVYFPDYAEPKYPTIISDNTFTDDSTSIYLRLDKCHQSITITSNDITGARNDAIRTWNVYDIDIVNPAIHCNNIVDSTNFGINNQVTAVNLDATNNWWGHYSGPTHSSNPSGTGDAVSDNVDYDPWAGKINGPIDPVEVGTPIYVTGHFTCDMVNAKFDWGDGAEDTLSILPGDTSITGFHTYSEAGVYTVTLTVDDGNGGSITMEFQYVVVYDPTVGFVTGGGWIDSPIGAYRDDPSLTGKANFGFVSKYKKGQSTPTGNTQFQFKAGDLNFHSSEYDWMVIAGAKAMYKGAGTINNAGTYNFMITAWDGQISRGAGDTFRIKIWYEDNGNEIIVYDNGTDTQLGGGQIKIHQN